MILEIVFSLKMFKYNNVLDVFPQEGKYILEFSKIFKVLLLIKYFCHLFKKLRPKSKFTHWLSNSWTTFIYSFLYFTKDFIHWWKSLFCSLWEFLNYSPQPYTEFCHKMDLNSFLIFWVFQCKYICYRKYVMMNWIWILWRIKKHRIQYLKKIGFSRKQTEHSSSQKKGRRRKGDGRSKCWAFDTIDRNSILML